PDGEGDVVVGLSVEGGVPDEPMARHRRDGREHALVADALLAEGLDEGGALAGVGAHGGGGWAGVQARAPACLHASSYSSRFASGAKAAFRRASTSPMDSP